MHTGIGNLLAHRILAYSACDVPVVGMHVCAYV